MSATAGKTIEIDGAKLSTQMIATVREWQSGNCKDDQPVIWHATTLDQVIDIILDPDKLAELEYKARFEMLISIRNLQ
jgi:hypothetical protein